jgi:predicted CopG family antitoxin
MDKDRTRSGRDRSPEADREKVAVKVTYDTHKRLKLLAIVEDRSVSDILDELVRERYGKRQKEIETLIKLAGNPTKVI